MEDSSSVFVLARDVYWNDAGNKVVVGPVSCMAARSRPLEGHVGSPVDTAASAGNRSLKALVRLQKGRVDVDAPFDVSLVRRDSEKSVFETSIHISKHFETEQVEIVFDVPEFPPVAEPGSYSLELKQGGVVVAVSPISLLEGFGGRPKSTRVTFEGT